MGNLKLGRQTKKEEPRKVWESGARRGYSRCEAACGVQAGIVRTTGTVFEFEVAPHLTDGLLGLFFHLQFLYLLIANVWGPVERCIHFLHLVFIVHSS